MEEIKENYIKYNSNLQLSCQYNNEIYVVSSGNHREILKPPITHAYYPTIKSQGPVTYKIINRYDFEFKEQKKNKELLMIKKNEPIEKGWNVQLLDDENEEEEDPDEKKYIKYGDIILIQTTEREANQYKYLTFPHQTEIILQQKSLYCYNAINNKSSWVITPIHDANGNKTKSTKKDKHITYNQPFHIVNMESMKFIMFDTINQLTYTDQRKLATPFTIVKN